MQDNGPQVVGEVREGQSARRGNDSGDKTVGIVWRPTLQMQREHGSWKKNILVLRGRVGAAALGVRTFPPKAIRGRLRT